MRTFRPRARARHSFRSSLLAGLTVVAGASAFAAPAQALTTTHTCALPTVDAQPVTLTTTPRTDPAYVTTSFTLEVGASVQWGAGLVAAFEPIGGRSVDMATTLSLGGGAATSPLQPVPASGPVVVQPPFRFGPFPANDYTPGITFSLASVGFTVVVKDENGKPIQFDPSTTPTPQTDSDPNTLQISCALSPPNQDTKLISVRGSLLTPRPTPTPPPTSTPTPTPAPQPTPSQNVPPLGASEVTATSAVVCWDVTGTLREPVLVLFVRDLGRYEGLETTRRDTYVLPDLRSRICFTLKTLPGTTYDPFLAFELSSGQYATQPVTSSNTQFTTPAIATTPTPTPTPTPYVPVTTPIVGPTPSPTPEPTPTPTPLPSPGPPLFATYDVAGTATLKTLTRGSLPLSGRLGTILEPVGGSIVTSLGLNPSSGSLTALGFLPVAAKVEFVSAGSTNGTLKNGSLSFNAKVRIKLPSVKTLGIELAGGANCQTKQISSIAFSSPQPTFTWEKGGPVAGTFAISDLTGCGFLTNLVSPLTQGSGNLVALSLTR